MEAQQPHLTAKITFSLEREPSRLQKAVSSSLLLSDDVRRRGSRGEPAS